MAGVTLGSAKIEPTGNFWNTSKWDGEFLRRYLEEIDPELDLFTAELSRPFPDCNDPEEYQVALLNVNQPTTYLGGIQKGEHLLESGKHVNAEKVQIFIDKEFYDLTPFNTPETIAIEFGAPESTHPHLQTLTFLHSVIAITGPAGHAFNSWRSRAKTKKAIDRPMWLRDFLAEKFPNARIMTYGYNSSLRDPDAANLIDYQRTFMQCLENSRR
ncbi:hypothetical protein EX30DRAFT_398707 [Ascodesmis nigricans]|uniref:Uncharacterized protein n=1 Tax=Ascodesmis nigricans TaxID=341454 RepID=A0A4S2MR77_9PEZI|nr:hypothetical protein EX30DRAFT_398707 [Ascodesmis nigricans]